MGQADIKPKTESKTKPIFYLLAGPNGSGKSTLYKALVSAKTIPSNAEFVNADLYEAAQLQHIADPQLRSEHARHWADARRTELLKTGQSFVSETVFSHESKLALIDEAHANGFFVMLLVVCVDNPSHLLARVAQRVTEGGHHVPDERILARYPRTLANLTIAVRLANVAFLYDAQSVKPETHAAVAICQGAATRLLVDPLPQWACTVLGMVKVE